jgi:hypothetical protein
MVNIEQRTEQRTNIIIPWKEQRKRTATPRESIPLRIIIARSLQLRNVLRQGIRPEMLDARAGKKRGPRTK